AAAEPGAGRGPSHESITMPVRAGHVIVFQSHEAAEQVEGIVVLGGGPEISAGAALDAVEEVELQVVGGLDLVARSRRHLPGVHRVDQVGRYQYDQLLLDAIAGGIAKEGSQDW